MWSCSMLSRHVGLQAASVRGTDGAATCYSGSGRHLAMAGGAPYRPARARVSSSTAALAACPVLLPTQLRPGHLLLAGSSSSGSSSLRRRPSRSGGLDGGPCALFTGIVQGQGKVSAVERRDEFSSIRIRFPEGSMAGIQIGASVAINGTCLTVVSAKGDECRFDIIGETLRCTNLGLLQEGSAVNYERSAKVGDEIGGHTVSGHIHCTAQLASVEKTEDNVRLQLGVPREWTKYILKKGFVAVDGCSLTVGEVGPDWFSVYLIPETLRVTVLGSKSTLGDSFNIEVEAQTQAIVDTVEKVVGRYMAERELGGALPAC